MIIIITPPTSAPEETAVVNVLFSAGLQVLHLRKPGAGREEYEQYVKAVWPKYRSRIVIHDHYELAREYGLRGVHVKQEEAEAFIRDGEYGRVSVSCHSFEEVDSLPFVPEYAFLSPVFDSISKPGYGAAFEREALREFLGRTRVPVVALGGVTAENAEECRRLGFSGVALLGYAWERPRETVERFRRMFPDTALSIAGFDPSSGAGVTADVKTFERHGVYGLGVTSAVTYQNQNEYFGTKWLTTEEITRQCEALLREFRPRYVKIGLVESFDTLEAIADYLHEALPGAQIIWDPILKASAGTRFHEGVDRERLRDILRKVYLVTPNREEAKTLFGRGTNHWSLADWAKETGTNILWKDGYAAGKLVTDYLITPRGTKCFSLPRTAGGKHGTGCALSAAITARLTSGYSLKEACRFGQEYVGEFIRSNATNLGTPHYVERVWANPFLESIPMQYITDWKEGISIEEQVEAVCRGGCRWVQLRMKDAPREEMIATGRRVKEICQRHGALFLVNDRVDVALELDADGVHLGKEDMNPQEARQLLGPGKIIGGTCNTFEDVVERYSQGADYVGLGPYAHTTTKKRLSPILGLEGCREIAARCSHEGIRLPIYAIGGIREEDIGPLAFFVTGIALSSLLKDADDMEDETRKVINLIKDKNE